MRYLSFTLFFLIFISFSLKANEDKVIKLHQNKSLDQLVLENEDSINAISEENEQTVDEIEEINTENISKENLNENSDDTISTNEVVTVLKSESILDLDENILKNYLESIQSIKSKSINREFIKILSNVELQNEENINTKIYYIIKKLYEIGEIGRAYNIIKNLESKNISNKDILYYFYLIEMNYLFSSFNLSEVCELKSLLLNQSVSLPEYLLEKTDIFCLTLENKSAEAKLLNSLLLENEKKIDQNFQELFSYMIADDEVDKKFNSLKDKPPKDLVFLYSAMLRINELALDEEFIEIDPENLTIPVILSESTKMDIRIKAANKAFYDDVISIDSLSALYQSVDFTSKEFNKPEETLSILNDNKELIMAFYYQLANIQIFPDQRLAVILDYWKFAKSVELEEIAYLITRNIIETFSPNSENTIYSSEIALAHVVNQNYTEATKWINLFEPSGNLNERKKYIKFLIALNETNDLNTIIEYLSSNNENFNKLNDQKTIETLLILSKFLKIEDVTLGKNSFNNILDERLMPTYYLIREIEDNIKEQNELALFILTLVSINNKNWSDLHPEHLKIILDSLSLYDEGKLIKPIILEILNEFEIF